MKRCWECKYEIREHEEYDSEGDASGNNDRTYWHKSCPRKNLRRNVIRQIEELESQLTSAYQQLAKIG